MSAGRVEGGGGAAAADRTGFWGHVAGAGAGPGSRLSCGGRPRSQTCRVVSCRVRRRGGGGLGKAASRGAPPQRQQRFAVDRAGGRRRTAWRPLYSDMLRGPNGLWVSDSRKRPTVYRLTVHCWMVEGSPVSVFVARTSPWGRIGSFRGQPVSASGGEQNSSEPPLRERETRGGCLPVTLALISVTDRLCWPTLPLSRAGETERRTERPGETPRRAAPPGAARSRAEPLPEKAEIPAAGADEHKSPAVS